MSVTKRRLYDTENVQLTEDVYDGARKSVEVA